MALTEILFDLSYLCAVMALGVRLLWEKDKNARFFGVMALLLGSGDAFHLLPRILSHLDAGGFAAHAAALSWGQFVTSITMTVFYVMYYFYYRAMSGDREPAKQWAVLGLAALRVALTLLPQNQWGAMPGSYLFGILRNVPFAALGALLVIWSCRHREKEGLERMGLLIFLSFLFYIPVVLWADSIPAIGALMMPKTVAYLLIVAMGFRRFVKGFRAENLFFLGATALVMGLLGGVFYREFTRYFAFEAVTHLGKLHVHTLVLGFVMMLAMYLFARRSDSLAAALKKPVHLYLAGLFLSVVCMLAIGMKEVAGTNPAVSRAALDGISGLGHILLSAGLVWSAARMGNAVRSER